MKTVQEFIHNIIYAIRKPNVRINWFFGDDQVKELSLGAEIETEEKFVLYHESNILIIIRTPTKHDIILYVLI